MTLEALLFILSGILVGIACGFMPSMGMAVAFIMLWPIILVQPFDASIAFMMVVYTSVFFASSVSALWLGVAGDPTSFPILQERNNIRRQDYGAALKRTAQASGITAIIGIVITTLLIGIASNYLVFFIKTTTSALLLIIMILISIFWSKNKIYQNIILVGIGGITGLVGWHIYLNAGFLVFNNPYLYNGVPLLPVVLGVYAVPIMWESAKQGWKSRNEKINIDADDFCIPKTNVSLGATTRGGIIGYFMGLVPMIGTSIASNVAWAAENRFQKNKTSLKTPVLDRITASEAANNAAASAVLAPLLVLGVAIVPSEMIILAIMQERGWNSSYVSLQTLLTVVVSISVACIILYKLCVTYAHFVMQYFFKYQFYILLVFVGILIYGVYYTGSNTLQQEFYLLVFFIASAIGFLLKKLEWNPIPLVIALMVSDMAVPIVLRAFQIVKSYM